MKIVKKILSTALIVLMLILLIITGLNYNKEKEKIKNLNQDIINLNSIKEELISQNKQLQDERYATSNNFTKIYSADVCTLRFESGTKL